MRGYVYAEEPRDGDAEALRRDAGARSATRSAAPRCRRPEGDLHRLAEAVRRTLAHELEVNPKVAASSARTSGRKGGVHLVTEGLAEAASATGRVFDTSLSEEGIIGRAVGMAIAGLMPVAEIQFRKYADPATEQLNNCGTMRWRTRESFRGADRRAHARRLRQGRRRPVAQR